MRLLLEEVLRACGHQPIAASDGTEAWSAFEREVPPMVILDWQMPGLDGLEVCRRIRAHPEGDITFVLMVTARDRADDLTAVLDAAPTPTRTPRPTPTPRWRRSSQSTSGRAQPGRTPTRCWR